MKYYGVSSGNGNDGVSHMFPDYIVKTDNPWIVAKLAATTTFKAGRGRKWCRENLQIDGEEDYTISAVIYNPPEDKDGSWCDANGAWLIFEVFPWDDDLPQRPIFETIEDCFGKREVLIEQRLDG